MVVNVPALQHLCNIVKTVKMHAPIQSDNLTDCGNLCTILLVSDIFVVLL